MIDINIVIGRFQPFTKGHLKCVEYVQDHFNVPTVLCVIETKKPDKRHPFLSDKLDPCFNALKRHGIIENYLYVKNANIVDVSKILYDKGYNVKYWTCGTDRINEYSKQLRNYKDKSMVDDSCQCIEIPRTDEDISATSARNFLLDDDKKNFEKIVPKEFDFNYLKKIYEK